MKILVLSDSHGEKEYMRMALRKEHPDAVIHLGDHAADSEALYTETIHIPVCRVRGNCDYYENQWPEEVCACWGGVNILAVHGHRYGVKNGLLRLNYAAMEKGAQIALFGHTHQPYCEERGGLWLLNPGACGGRSPSYATIEINGADISCQVKDLFLEDEK